MPAKQDIVVIEGLSAADYSPRGLQALSSLSEELQELRRRVAELETENKALALLADQDPMMPLVNRRAFTRELTRQIAHSRRHGDPSSMLYVDVDRMKWINDRYGHAAGDAALNHVAALLLAQVRLEDSVGRLGGDEFGVLLVGSAEPAAAEKARALSHELRTRPLDWMGTKILVTAAIGVHAIRDHENADEVLASADLAMYRVKHAGRLVENLALAASRA